MYVRGTTPTTFQGEYELGLTKRAICIDPADSRVVIHTASRLHYAKAYPVEMNVKVKDIGDVAPEDLSYVITYYTAENGPAGASPQATRTTYRAENELAGMHH